MHLCGLLGCHWILLVAEAMAGRDGASWGVPTPPGAVLPLLTYGGLLLILWQGRFRWTGLPLVALAAWLWAGAERPSLLIASLGAVIGMQGEDGRDISHEKGDGYEVAAWLENDGDTAEQASAAGRPGLLVSERQARTSIGGAEVLLVRGKQALVALDGCDGALAW